MEMFEAPTLVCRDGCLLFLFPSPSCCKTKSRKEPRLVRADVESCNLVVWKRRIEIFDALTSVRGDVLCFLVALPLLEEEK